MKLYKFVGGWFNGLTVTEGQAREMYEKHGNGLTMDWSKERASGGWVPRAELDNQYMFEGYLSPMWDGDGHLVNGQFKRMSLCDDGDKLNTYCYVLRYETQAVYDLLSM